MRLRDRIKLLEIKMDLFGVQGLFATNPEGDSKMDVVELVPSVSFSPRMNLHGRMSDSVFPIITHVDFYKCTEFGGGEGNFFSLTPRVLVRIN